jgi:hypothetical protein
LTGALVAGFAALTASYLHPASPEGK